MIKLADVAFYGGLAIMAVALAFGAGFLWKVGTAIFGIGAVANFWFMAENKGDN